MSNSIFGRDDSERHDVYFSVLNKYYHTLLKAEASMERDLRTLNNSDMESDEFEADIKSLLKDAMESRAKVGAKIVKHRRHMGW